MPELFTMILCGINVQRLFNLEHLLVLLAIPISHTSIQFMDLVEIFNVSLDFSAIYCACFSGC